MSPTQIYKVDGKRVPGVTTILGNIGWNRRPLMIWANRLGLEGKSLDEETVAMDVGSVAHYLIECELHGIPFDRESIQEHFKDK